MVVFGLAIEISLDSRTPEQNQSFGHIVMQLLYKMAIGSKKGRLRCKMNLTPTRGVSHLEIDSRGP